MTINPLDISTEISSLERQIELFLLINLSIIPSPQDLQSLNQRIQKAKSLLEENADSLKNYKQDPVTLLSRISVLESSLELLENIYKASLGVLLQTSLIPSSSTQVPHVDSSSEVPSAYEVLDPSAYEISEEEAAARSLAPEAAFQLDDEDLQAAIAVSLGATGEFPFSPNETQIDEDALLQEAIAASLEGMVGDQQLGPSSSSHSSKPKPKRVIFSEAVFGLTDGNLERDQLPKIREELFKLPNFETEYQQHLKNFQGIVVQADLVKSALTRTSIDFALLGLKKAIDKGNENRCKFFVNLLHQLKVVNEEGTERQDYRVLHDELVRSFQKL